MRTPWFKGEQYGWGWYPATWQGWIVLAVFIAVAVLNFIWIDSTSHSESDTLRPFILQTAAMTLILILICWLTGEKPGRRWGDKK